jgi:hypothetical protein
MTKQSKYQDHTLQLRVELQTQSITENQEVYLMMTTSF